MKDRGASCRLVTRSRRGVGLLIALIWLWALPLVPDASAQPPNRAGSKFYPDVNDTAESLLRNAASHAREQQWGEAVDIYQKVIQQFGDKVARLPREGAEAGPAADTQLYVDVRQFCQRRIAVLPAAARAVYRARLDVQAERWFKLGESTRDRAMLRRVVDQAFCSSWGDDAAELLGDLAFQDGRFAEALASYGRLVADRPGPNAALVHPDPNVDLAKVSAKILLARAALGERPPGPAELASFAREYPDARGSLAGRDGLFSEIVPRALAEDRLAPPASPDGRWPTFAGSPSRSRVAAGPVDVGSVQWRVDLDPIRSGQGPSYRPSPAFTPRNPGPPSELKLGYHPIVVGDHVIVSDESKVVAYNLNDRPDATPGVAPGPIKEAWKHDEGQGGPQVQPAAAGNPRFTLTASGDRVFARMGPGPSAAGITDRMRGSASGSYLVALDRSADGKLLWMRPASDVASVLKPADGRVLTTGFEGTPVADARSAYVALTDHSHHTSTYVACLDAETGVTRWVRYVGAASADNEPAFNMGGMVSTATLGDSGHRLLTLDGPTIYYQTNLGAVVALDAESGTIRWAATYPRLERNVASRDLNPAIVHDGLVIVAPADATSIYAFEAATGRLVWKTDPLPDEVKLAHLLGVAKGRLVATGGRVLLFDVKNGKLLHTWPDTGQGFEPYGRGLLAGDKIYWPTRTEIHVLDQATGLRSDPPIRLQESFQTTGGNLAVGDGYLVVAQADQLVVFCQNRRLIQRYREEIALNPDDAAPYFRMARAAEATGDDQLALASLDQAVSRVPKVDSQDAAPSLDAARDQRFRLLLRLGDKAKAAGDFGQAEASYREAADSARADRDRLRARLAESDVQLRSGRPVLAVGTLQSLLAEDRLHSIAVATEDGRRSIRSDLLIGDRLGSIIEEHGRGVYEKYDREARDLLDRGRRELEPRMIAEVARSYPAAEVVAESYAALGAYYEAHAMPGEAARAFKRLLAVATDDAAKARALLGLGRAYEAQRLWVPSRDAFAQAAARFPKQAVDPADGGEPGTVGAYASARLARAPFDRMKGDRAEPAVPVPLVRLNAQPLDGGARPVAAVGVPPSGEFGRVFLAKGGAIRPAVTAEGEPPWSADLGGPPVWVGYLADRLLAATESRVVAVDVRKGTLLWQFETGTPAPARRGPDPFARGDEPSRPGTDSAASSGPLQGFRVEGGRLYLLRGSQEILALDGDTGQVDWTYRAVVGSLNPKLWVDHNRVVFQTRQPNAIVVLDARSGRRKGDFPQAPDAEAWSRDPVPVDDDRVALVTDRLTVTLFDTSRGVNAWQFRESTTMPTNGPPRVLGDAERLLVVHDGSTLIRLDASNGSRLWSRPLGTEDLSERPEALASDAGKVFWVSDQIISGASLKDGSLLWTHHLAGPRSGWAVELTDRCVLAYPGLPRKAGNAIEGLPLVFRRRDDGVLVQRLLFPVPVSDVAVRLSPGGGVVATQAGLWALGERSPVDGPDRSR